VNTDSFDLAELSELARISQRTVRYYVQQGLIRSPESRGPGARYTRDSLDRLRLIRRFQREHLPLAEIRRRLDGLGDVEIHELAEAGPELSQQSSANEYIASVLTPRMETLSSHTNNTQAPILADRDVVEKSKPRADRSQWDRFTLAPDVELHVRRPLTREQNRQVERLMEAARVIFQEESP